VPVVQCKSNQSGSLGLRQTEGCLTASGPFIPEAPDHVINSCAVDIIAMLHSQVPRELGLKEHGLRILKPDPSYVSLGPDGSSVALWRDPTRTAAEIEEHSRADAQAFLEFLSRLDRLITTALPVMGTDTARPAPKLVLNTLRASVRNRKQMSDIVALLTGSASLAVDERFEHPLVKGALLNLAAGAGPVDEPGSGLGFLLLALISRVGVGRPIGGMQTLTDALISVIEAGAGTVVTGAKVGEILAGQDSLYIYALTVPSAPRQGWNELRQPAVDAILGKLGKYVQPLEQAELGRIVETPQDFPTRLNARNGCITHLDMGFLDSGPLRPTVGLGLGKTPLDGLFPGGSGTHPGGGVSGLPGRTAAQRVTRWPKRKLTGAAQRGSRPRVTRVTRCSDDGGAAASGDVSA
jgi:phytoene dehydrogenase-like protein